MRRRRSHHRGIAVAQPWQRAVASCPIAVNATSQPPVLCSLWVESGPSSQEGDAYSACPPRISAYIMAGSFCNNSNPASLGLGGYVRGLLVTCGAAGASDDSSPAMTMASATCSKPTGPRASRGSETLRTTLPPAIPRVTWVTALNASTILRRSLSCADHYPAPITILRRSLASKREKKAVAPQCQ